MLQSYSLSIFVDVIVASSAPATARVCGLLASKRGGGCKAANASVEPSVHLCVQRLPML
jgi:hypothetical protein